MIHEKMLKSLNLWVKQLLMLVWKNVHLRWRTSSVGCSHRLVGRVPIFLLIELLWPLVLYLIMVLMRVNFPPEQRQDYLWRPVALPSAGTLPFIQSLLCDLDQDGHKNQYSQMPHYPNATVNDVYSLLDEFGSLNGTLDSFCSSVQSLAQQKTCSNFTVILPPQCQQDVVPLSCYLGDPEGFQSFLTSDLQFSPSLAEGILGATVNNGNIGFGGFPFRGKRQLPSFPALPELTPNALRTLVCVDNGSLLNGFLTLPSNLTTADVTEAVCQLNSSQLNALAQELQHQVSLPKGCDPLDNFAGFASLERGQELFQKFSQFSTNGLFDSLNFDPEQSGNLSATQFINESRQFLCGDVEGGVTSVGLLLLSALYGNKYQQSTAELTGGNISFIPEQVSMKILYTPHNALTQRIIVRASKTFQTFISIINWADQISNCSDQFLINFPSNSTQANTSRQLLATLSGDNTQQISPLFRPVYDQLLANRSLNASTVEFAQQLLNESASDNIWNIVTNVRDAASSLRDMLARFDWDVFYPVEDEASLEALAQNYSRQSELGFTTVFAGVVFDGVDQDILSNVSIKIRMNASSVVDPYDITQSVWTPGPENNGWKKAYLSGGFVFIQDLVERGVAEEMVGHSIPTPGLYLQQMPYPCYMHDGYVVAMEFVLAVAVLFAWLFPVAMTVRAIVREKQSRLKEYIKMVGVSDTQLRLARLFVSGCIFMVTVLFITVLLKAGNILPLTDWSIVFLYLSLYALVMLGYSFLVSTFFTNANLAACVASLIYFMVLFAHTTLVAKQQDMSPFTVGLCCLWAPLGFALGAQYLVQWEVQQVGLQWSNLSELAGTDSQLSFAAVALILCLDTLLYFLATWYIEQVAPGRYGVAKPLYFPFLPSYWLGQRGRDCAQTNSEQLDHVASAEGPVCEESPAGLKLSIAVHRLTKMYNTCRRKKVTAVNDLTLNFFEGQITALLGHNGAGKTTTLSILAGLFEPTSGTASIYGNSIRRHMDLIRQGLGVCPQHNILFNELTVEEHLLFFGLLKGLSWKECTTQIPEWLEKVELSPHAHKLAKHLSGGMKRKLSILIAFMGGSRTIILDEPTAGVDPFARRQIWDFLLRQRQGRTIILSTHHMDEAEILGDRIAIISHGSLICCGSFEFLKHRFGRGHTLALVTSSQLSESSEHVEAITTFLEGFVKRVKLEELRGQEIRYLLPLTGARANVLTYLFRELETEKQRLGVVSYGLTACSMEEIFVELTEKNEQRSEVSEKDSVLLSSEGPIKSTDDETTSSDGSSDRPDDITLDDTPLFGNDHEEARDRMSGCRLWFSQFMALTVKRFHYTRHRMVALLVQNVVPFFWLVLGLLIAYLLQRVSDPPPIELSPNHLFMVNKYNYLFAGGNRTNATSKYLDSLFQPCGVGGHLTASDPTHCFSETVYNASSDYPCSEYPGHQYLCTCQNDTGEYGCRDAGPFPPDQPSCFNGTGSGSRVQDVSVLVDPAHPLKSDKTLTTYLLRSKQSFIQQRYGGLSFGYERDDVNATLDNYNDPFLAVRSAAKVWYSLKAYHAMPSYLNVMNNALMRGELDPSKHQYSYGFKTISHPFATSDLSKLSYAIKEKHSFLVIPMAMMFTMGFVVAGFVLLLIEERSGNVKHLQLVCGMNKAVYWLANSTWDLCWYVCFSLLVVVLFQAFQDPFYTDPEVVPLFVLILLAYGLAVTPWVYTLSFLFTSPATAYVVLFCLNFFGGFCVLIVDAILLFLNGANSTDNALNYPLAAIPIPSYVLGRSMLYISSDLPLYKEVASYGVFETPNPYSQLAPLLGALLTQAIVYSLILVIIELWPYLRGIMCRGRSSVTSLPEPLDSDEEVCRERAKVKNNESYNEILSMDDLSRVYRINLGRHKRVAVNQLCLKVNKGECFGLLGVNGAGKTTTFKMLTGDIRPSAGDAVIAGHHLSEARGPVQASIGYCPQVDALIDQLTGRQHLVLFASLRGLSRSTTKEVVQGTLNKLGLTQYADRAVGTYSGGNRRKLSTAISLLANPPLVLLDEPTSGVDPRARHFLWSIVRGIVSSSEQSVILTTHSMAECEALCSRVAIMVNGEFHCLGSPQQLKSTYGSGYRLKVRVAGQIEPVKEFVRQNFPGAVLKEEHYTTLVYQLPTSDTLLLHNVFESMEHARETLDIQDYSVSQTTLDDVFIHFANEQSEEVGLMRQAVSVHEVLPDLVPSQDALTTAL